MVLITNLKQKSNYKGKICWNTSIYWGGTWSMLVRNGEPLEYKHKEEETSVSVN